MEPADHAEPAGNDAAVRRVTKNEAKNVDLHHLRKHADMTEKEKMLRGEFYNARDPEIIAMYHHARRLLKEYNYHLDSTDSARREQILQELLGFKGDNVWIEPPFHADYGENVHIGENTFINTNCIFLDDNKITIGKNVLIAPCVQLYTAAHPLKASERILADTALDKARQATYRTNSKPIEIGGNTVAMPGVRIGTNTTIGACSLVTKDIPDNVLAFGNPCRVIKEFVKPEPGRASRFAFIKRGFVEPLP